MCLTVLADRAGTYGHCRFFRAPGMSGRSEISPLHCLGLSGQIDPRSYADMPGQYILCCGWEPYEPHYLAQCFLAWIRTETDPAQHLNVDMSSPVKNHI